jgi:glycosyltransferase involved in cell wall biosynthesis
MKVLYVARLFSGLETSLVARTWKPTGVPTIHRVVERLDRDADLRLILTDKNHTRLWKESSDADVRVAGLRAPVTVLAGAANPKRRMAGVLRELRHTWRILIAALRWRPDIIYIDHANAVAAGVLGRLPVAPVVFRVMGVYPVMRQALSGRRLGLRVLRWAYRAPFARVICTEDGSGGMAWLNQALRPSVRYELMLNGVDVPPSGAAAPQTEGDRRTSVLFVGKLEREKGCDPFIESFLRALAGAPGELRAIVVGTGARADAMKAAVKEHRAGDAVTFMERVPHAQILDIQRRADIYVSLNRLGNFSNANLEAMRMGACMILPSHLPDVGAENPTGRLLPVDAYAGISDPDAVEELSGRLLELHQDPVRRRQMSERMRAAAERLVSTWEQRVDWEVDLLFAIAGKPSPARQPRDDAA